jgi:hypothetical protein
VLSVDFFATIFFAAALRGAAVFFVDFLGAVRFRTCCFICFFFAAAAFFDFVDFFLVFFLVAIGAV